MSQDGDSQYIPYRDYFKVQLSALQDDINSLKADIKEISRGVATNRDFDGFRESLKERLSRVELEAYGLKEALGETDRATRANEAAMLEIKSSLARIGELEKIVRSNEREIIISRRIVAALGSIVISILIALGSAWLKGMLGL